MAKSKVKAKKAPAKSKTSKPVKKTAKKPAAKKAAPKAKKLSKPLVKSKTAKKPATSKVAKKPIKKTPVKKAVAKKSPVAKPKAKAPAKSKVKAAPVKKIVTKTTAKPVTKAPVPQQKSAPISKTKTTKKRLQDDINMRYSDDELREFKQLIDKKLVTAREELKYLKESLENHNDTQAGNKAWNMEEGSDTSEMETLMNQIARQHQYIRNLEMALVRIENKTYGICRLTGKLIPKERLRIVPHATLSLEAKMARKSEDTLPADAAAAMPPSDFAEGFED